jgi:hypothetical protein
MTASPRSASSVPAVDVSNSHAPIGTVVLTEVLDWLYGSGSSMACGGCSTGMFEGGRGRCVSGLSMVEQGSFTGESVVAGLELEEHVAGRAGGGGGA